jgi:hypothetical protein
VLEDINFKLNTEGKSNFEIPKRRRKKEGIRCGGELSLLYYGADVRVIYQERELEMKSFMASGGRRR